MAAIQPLGNDDYWLKVAGFALGLAGTIISIYNLWKAREKYDARVIVTPGPLNALRKPTFAVSIYNQGNKPFSVIAASYESPEFYFDQDESEGSMLVPFYVPMPDNLIFLTPGQGAALSYAEPALETFIFIVHVQIHNGKWFEGEVERTPAIEPAHLLQTALRIALEHWFVSVGPNRDYVEIVEEPNFMAGSGWSDKDLAEQAKLTPFRFSLPSAPRDRRLLLEVDPSPQGVKRAQSLYETLVANAPFLFDPGTTPIGNITLSWRDDLYEILFDPLKRMRFAAELGVGELYEPQHSGLASRFVNAPRRWLAGINNRSWRRRKLPELTRRP